MYKNTMFVSCPFCQKGVDDVVNGKIPFKGQLPDPLYIYCSDICRQKDWQIRHQFDCTGKRNMVRVTEDEVKRIEKNNLFLRKATKTSQQEREREETLSKIKLDELNFEREIGKGSYGVVQLATHKPTGYKVAVKKLDKIKNYKIIHIFRREIAIHKKLRHPNILRLYTCLEDSKFFYLVLEYTSEGNLFNWIRKVKSFSE